KLLKTRYVHNKFCCDVRHEKKQLATSKLAKDRLPKFRTPFADRTSGYVRHHWHARRVGCRNRRLSDGARSHPCPHSTCRVAHHRGSGNRHLAGRESAAHLESHPGRHHWSAARLKVQQTAISRVAQDALRSVYQRTKTGVGGS